MDENEKTLEELFMEDEPEDTTEEVIEETEPTEETVETEETTEEETTEESEDGKEKETLLETIPFTHNHKTTELDKNSVNKIAESLGVSEPEVVTMLQKGTNYDLKLSQYDRDYGGAIGRIEEYARANNLSLPEAQERILGLVDTAEIFAIMQQIREENPEMEPETAGMLARERHAGIRAKSQLEQRNYADRESQRIESLWMDFFNKHPELSDKSIPQEVYAYFAQGYSPEESYLKYQLDSVNKKQDEIDTKINQINKVKEVKETSPGSLEGSKPETKKDPFDEGWDSAFG